MTAVLEPVTMATDAVAGQPRPLRPTNQARPHRLAVPTWWRDAVGSLTWLSLLIVTALWVANSGIQELSQGLGPALSSLGRITALWSSDLLLLMVLLMARIPVVERVYGQDELARRHRWVGFTSINLLVAHLVFTLAGYSITYHHNVFAETWDVLVTYPGMLLAGAATVALFMVALTSRKAARARMRYESWHLLHLYAYLGVALAIPHQLWTGTEFVSSPIATIYWWTLYGASLGAILIWRVVTPLLRSRRHSLVVEQVVRENHDTVSVVMTGHRPDQMVSAGQFMNWRFMGRDGWTRGNPFSISAEPTADRVRFTAKALGDGSAALADLRPGTKVLVEGPYGRLHGGVRTRAKVTLIGAGIGITPLRALLEELDAAPGDITLIYRASHAQDLVLTDEIDDLARRKGARVFYVIGARVNGRRSWLPAQAAHLSDVQALRELVPDIAQHDVYLCGAESWMDASREAALGAGVPAKNVHRERFSW